MTQVTARLQRGPAPLASLPLYRPLIEREEIEASTRALQSGWLGMGNYVGEFEEAIKAFIEAPDHFVAAVSTGTAGLHLALLAAGVGPGDEVITPAFNFHGAFQAIRATGAEPVFCDIDEDTLCASPSKIEELIGHKTKAILPLDYCCISCDYENIDKLARQHKLRIIHDAAHSFGSRYQGKMTGSFSDICVFSFDPVKTITCIDGGAVVLRVAEELEHVRSTRMLGTDQSAQASYSNKRAKAAALKHQGFRYHMSNVHAAIGLAQLAKIDGFIAARRAACEYYSLSLKDVDCIVTPKADFQDVAPFLYYIRVPAEHRDPLRSYLADSNIDAGNHWPAGHWFSWLQGCRSGDLSVSDKVAREIVTLPLASDMTETTIDRVVERIKAYFKLRA